jgi:hypothetical protein
MGTITIIDVFRAMKVKTDKRLTWEVGKAVAQKWRDENGAPPPLLMTNKTNGGGSHCIAHYPLSYALVIEEVIRRSTLVLRPPSQPDLFDET